MRSTPWVNFYNLNSPSATRLSVSEMNLSIFFTLFFVISHPFGVASLLKNKLFCRLSTGALSRLIVSDRTVWNAVNNLRISHVSYKALMLKCIWQILDYTHTHIYVYVSLKKHVDFVGIKLY
jgi:hypothetical protein